MRLGKEGYRAIHQACYDTAKYLAKGIEKLGHFDIIYGGKGGMPALSWKLKEDAKINFNLYDFVDRLRMSGWLVPAYSMPENRKDLVIQRILVRHGFSFGMASLLIADMKRALTHLEKHPTSVSLSEKKAGSYDHSGP